MKHSIPLEQAQQMIGRFQEMREEILSPEFRGKDILAFSETFDAEELRTLLNQEGCVAFRIHSGMDEQFKVHSILFAVDKAGKELLGIIMDQAHRCPPFCLANPELEEVPYFVEDKAAV